MTATRIVILGSGFAGIEVLKNLQNKNDSSIDITLVSKDNFLLFTPMLPEVATGIIETRHIVTQVRAFCKEAKFYEAKVDTIDFRNKKVSVKHKIGNHFNPSDIHTHILDYDYLAIALGSETNFFGMTDIERNCFTMKSIDDAIILRNHIISVLEQASIEQDSKDLRKSLLTFIVVGGGFSGIETVGALNDFIRETAEEFYKNICMTDIRIVLVTDDDKILVEIDKELGKFALQKLKDRGVEFMMNTQVSGAAPNSIKLNNGIVIPSYTLIWNRAIPIRIRSGKTSSMKLSRA
jgi:NADH dehydrogenase